MITKLTTASAALCLLVLFTDPASGCSCAKVTPCEAFGSASAVFVGRMLGGSDRVREYTKDGQTFSIEAGEARFTVEESFKGVTATEVTVFLMNMKGSSCEGMAALVRGERYLVYAYYLDSVGGLSVGACSPTKPFSAANADLEFLRNLPSPGKGGRLYGQVAVETGAQEPAPLAEITLTIEDETHNITQIRTGRDGKFEMNGLRPGKYLVSPLLPENYVFRDEYQRKREVHVFDRGCSGANFWVNVNGRVAGRVTDSRGRPAPTFVELESVDQRRRSFSDETDQEGVYEIRGIPPGQYVLKIDMKKDGKDIGYFYPDTHDRSKASLIDMSMGQKIEGKDFHLASSVEVISVRGAVTYSDGRPAANAEVRLIRERSDPDTAYKIDDSFSYDDTETDDLGRFKVRGYKGLSYKILVFDNLRTAIEENRESGRIETDKMLLTKDVDNVKVVLPLKPRSTAKEGPQKKTAPLQ